MCGDGHVELEWTNTACFTDHVGFADTPGCSHRGQQRTSVGRPKVRDELELMLPERRSSHVALQVLPCRLVVQRNRHEPRDIRQRFPFTADRLGGGSWLN